MAMRRGFSILITASQAAERLEVSVQRVLAWAAQGALPIAGQDEDGRALFREHVIEGRGADLAAGRLILARPARPVMTLPCGCVVSPDGEPLFRCALADRLDATALMAEALAAATPGDEQFRRLVEVTAAALDRHIASPAARQIKPSGKRHTACDPHENETARPGASRTGRVPSIPSRSTVPSVGKPQDEPCRSPPTL